MSAWQKSLVIPRSSILLICLHPKPRSERHSLDPSWKILGFKMLSLSDINSELPAHLAEFESVIIYYPEPEEVRINEVKRRNDSFVFIWIWFSYSYTLHLFYQCYVKWRSGNIQTAVRLLLTELYSSVLLPHVQNHSCVYPITPVRRKYLNVDWQVETSTYGILAWYLRVW